MSVRTASSLQDLSLKAHFFSDTHAFMRRNGAGHLHTRTIFATPAEQIYLNGDTLDFDHIYRKLRKRGLGLEEFPDSFPAALEILTEMGLDHDKAERHLRFFDVLMQKASQGATIIQTRGNHDIGLEGLDGETVAGIHIRNSDIYDTGSKGRFLIEHGHLFDPGFLKKYTGLYRVGSWFLDGSSAIDDNMARLVPRLDEAFIATNLTKKLGKSIGVMKKFRKRAAYAAASLDLQGVICGHIHKLEDKPVADKRKIKVESDDGRRAKIRYLNIGDGQTHGSSLMHTASGDWVHIIDPKAQLPKSSKAILKSANPLQSCRDQTQAYLQSLWNAQLAYWREEEAQRAALTVEQSNTGKGKPQPAAA